MRDKTKPNLLKIFFRATLLGVFAIIISFFLKIVPCKILDSAKETTQLTLCKLPNPFKDLSDISTKFFGISNNPLTGLVLQFLIPFIFFLIIFVSARKNTRKVLDLTKK